MNELTVFQFKEDREIRTLERDGEPWFVAKDVCDILGLANSRDALAKMLDDDEAGVENFYVRSENGVMQNREMNIINESGLYNLIFRSNKPEAKAFRKWVTSKVLPSIRKKGYYASPQLTEKQADDLSMINIVLRQNITTAEKLQELEYKMDRLLNHFILEHPVSQKEAEKREFFQNLENKCTYR